MKENGKLKKLFARSEVTVILAVLILGLIFTVCSDSFLTAYNFFNLGRNAAVYMFIALGQAMVVIVGNFLYAAQVSGREVQCEGRRILCKFRQCYCDKGQH